MKKVMIRVLLGYALLAFLMVVSFFIIGYRTAGMQGGWNAAGTGLLFSVLGLPLAGFLIALKFWGGYASRWGEYNYKKELEGEPKDREHNPEKW